MACPVCGGESCTGMPNAVHLMSYPFLPGGVDPMADKDYVIAPHKLVEWRDDGTGRIVYGTGDRVPMADAVKFGLVDEPKPAKATAAKKAPAKKAATRARRPTEDRARKPGSNR